MPTFLTVKEAKESRQEKLSNIEAIETLAKNEKRDLTTDEVAVVDTLLAEHSSMAIDVERAEKLAEIRKASAAAPIENTATLRAPAVAKDEDDGSFGFKTLGEQLYVALQASKSGYQNIDPRLKNILSAAGSDEQRIASNPDGGFLIAPAFMPLLLSTSTEEDPTAGRVTPVPMSARNISFAARVDKNHSTSVSGGFTVAYTGETQTPTSSLATFEQVKLSAHKLVGLAYASDELLAESPISFAALMAMSFTQQFQSVILQKRLSGTGVGMPEGILTTPCLISTTRTTGATLKGEDIKLVRARVYGYGRAVWLANHDCYGALSSAHTALTNSDTPLFVPGNGVDVPDTILGRPVFWTEYAKSLGTAGDLICGDWSQYLHGTFNGEDVKQSQSAHIRFLESEQAFKFWLQHDGRCWWRSALTPVESSTTLSPFVTVAA